MSGITINHDSCSIFDSSKVQEIPKLDIRTINKLSYERKLRSVYDIKIKYDIITAKTIQMH